MQLRVCALVSGGFANDPTFENYHSWRANFALWSISSSPLILSFDLTDQNKTAEVWDIISNRALLDINAAWAGDAGQLVRTDYNTSKPAALIAGPCRADATTQRWELDAAVSNRETSILYSLTHKLHAQVDTGVLKLKQTYLMGRQGTGAIKSADPNDGRCITVPGCTPLDHNFEVTVERCHAKDVSAKCNSKNQQWDFNRTSGFIKSRMAAPTGMALLVRVSSPMVLIFRCAWLT